MEETVTVKNFFILILGIFFFCFPVLPFLFVCTLWCIIVRIGVKIFYKQTLSVAIPSWERAQVFMEKDIQTEPGIVITIPIIVSGIVDITQFQESFEFSLIKKQKGKMTPSTYKKFHQYPVSCMGYLFYAWEKNFNINHHIQKLDEKLTEANIDIFLSRRSRFKFPPRCSMWEILLAHNYNDEDTTLLIVRFQHYVSDGMSMLNLLNKLQLPTTKYSDISKEKKLTSNSSSSKTNFQKIKDITNSIFSLPSQLHALFLKFENISVGGEDTGVELFTKTKAFSLENLRIAKNVAGVNLSALIHHTLSVALRKFILDNHGSEYIPKVLSVLYMIPKQDHPDNSLTNHYRSEHMELPLHPDNLAECDKQHRQCLSKSEGIDVVDVILKLMIVVPNFIFKNILVPQPDKHVGVVVSNIVGPSKCVSIFDNKVLDMNFYVGSIKNPWIFLCILSYNGNVRFGLGGKSRVFLDQEHFLTFRNDFERMMDGIINSYAL